MVYFSVVFLCNALLFLLVLADRYTIWTTLFTSAMTYALSLVAAVPFGHNAMSEFPVNHLCVGINVILLFLSSLFLYKNNFLQKLYLCVLALANYAFINLILEISFGFMPIRTTGVLAALFSIFVYVVITFLFVLCFYHIFHLFSTRGMSTFIIGAILLQAIAYFISSGFINAFLKSDYSVTRLFYSALLYIFTIFAFRSVYHAAKYMENKTLYTSNDKITELQSIRFGDMEASIREVRGMKEVSDFTLDAIAVMVHDREFLKIPDSIDFFREKYAHKPVLKFYNENPYIDAIIANNATFAENNYINFDSNVVVGNSTLKTLEVCMIIDEILYKARNQALTSDSSKRIHLTVYPTDNTLIFEVVYSAQVPKDEDFGLFRKSISEFFESVKGKSLSELLHKQSAQDQFLASGLDETEVIVSKYGGKVNSFNIDSDVIIRISVNFKSEVAE